MKALVVLAMVVGAAANANVKDATVRSGLKGGAAAAKGGAAAVKGSSAATKAGTSLGAILEAIHTSTIPVDSAVASFKNGILKANLDSNTTGTLVQGFEVTVLDKGCLDSGLSADAYKVLSQSVDQIVLRNVRAKTTVNGLVQIAKNSDANQDGQVDAAEQKASDDAAQELTTQATMFRADYGKATGKNAKEAIKGTKELTRRCGVNPALSAYAN